MKCMTFNIWNYTRPWNERKEVIANLIKAHQPDVVGLQETRHDFRFERGRGQGEQIAALTGYHPTWALGQVYLPILRVDEGVTTLTRERPKQVMVKQLSRQTHEREDESQRVCLGVVIGWGEGELHFYNSHFSLSQNARVSNAAEVWRFMQEQSGDTPAVLVGDLNAVPGERAIRFLRGEEEVDGMSADLDDCWTVAHPDAPGFTYASWDPVRRIDYVLARNLPGPVRSATVVGGEAVNGVYASDHMGIVVDF